VAVGALTLKPRSGGIFAGLRRTVMTRAAVAVAGVTGSPHPRSHVARPQDSTNPALTRQRPQPAATRTGPDFHALATIPRE
jgi:hypothetical protein